MKNSAKKLKKSLKKNELRKPLPFIGAIEIQHHSELIATKPKTKPIMKPQQRNLQQDIQSAIAQANLLGAHGVKISNIQFTTEGIKLTANELYPQQELFQMRNKVFEQYGNEDAAIRNKFTQHRALTGDEPYKDDDQFAIIKEKILTEHEGQS